MTRPSVAGPTGIVIGPPVSMACMPRCIPSVGFMATVRTRGRAWVLLLPKDDFLAVAERHPELREQLAALATDRRQRNRATLASGRGRGGSWSTRSE